MSRSLPRSFAVTAIAIIALALAAVSPATAAPPGTDGNLHFTTLQKVWSWLDSLHEWWSEAVAAKVTTGEATSAATEPVCEVARGTGAEDSSGAVSDPNGCT